MSFSKLEQGFTRPIRGFVGLKITMNTEHARAALG